jgi:hypothetical protein
MPAAETQRTNLLLRWSAGICASISLAALVAHVFGVLRMDFFLTFFGIPSLLLLFSLAAWAKRINATTFLTCLRVGLAGGFLATLAYDLVRFLIGLTHLFQYNGFVAIYIFGSWITGKPVTTAAAAVAGWIYHFWNGLSFGVMYVVAFPRRHWLYGVAYGIVMETMMLGLFPLFLRITNKRDFILISMFGHMVYGAVLGLFAERSFAKLGRPSWRPEKMPTNPA